MKERQILFSAPMVRAILDGSKSQTRRPVTPQPLTRPGMDCTRLVFLSRKGVPSWDLASTDPFIASLCPYGCPGDRLWVRETWRASSAHDDLPPRDIPVGDSIEYGADRERILTGRLRPGMFMPRWASRIDLEVTAVRVEQLQSISNEDAAAEGIPSRAGGGMAPWIDYGKLWESINGTGSWDANPWVWVVEFRRVKP